MHLLIILRERIMYSRKYKPFLGNIDFKVAVNLIYMIHCTEQIQCITDTQPPFLPYDEKGASLSFLPAYKACRQKPFQSAVIRKNCIYSSSRSIFSQIVFLQAIIGYDYI